MKWYGYISGDPLLPGSYRLMPNYEDEYRPSCFSGCTICAILLEVGDPAPTAPLSIPDDIKTLIAVGLAEGTGQRIPPSYDYRVLLRC